MPKYTFKIFTYIKQILFRPLPIPPVKVKDKISRSKLKVRFIPDVTSRHTIINRSIGGDFHFRINFKKIAYTKTSARFNTSFF